MSIVAVTGGSGFIGSHVIDRLVEVGHAPINYDISSPDYVQSCRYVRGDIMDLERLKRAFQGVDYVFNLAAEANVNRFFESPLYSNLITSQGVLNVLEAARTNGVKRVIQASTEWIYGSPDGDGNNIVTEETPYAQNPDHLYTSSKIAAELFVKNYAHLYGVSYTIMRYGIPFGERARPETVTPIFIRKILKGEEVTVHGDGSQTRQFIYVRDLSAGNVACLNEQARNEIVNLNGSKMISVLDVIRTLEEILGKKAKIKFLVDRPGNFKGRFISSEKAKRLIGWEPAHQYEDALRKYVAWFIKYEEA